MLGLTLSFDINGDSINAAAIGTLLMIAVGWLPIIGPLVAGFVAGTLVRTIARGLKIGLLIGIIGAFWVYLLFGQFTVSVLPYGIIGTLLSQITTDAYSIGPAIMGGAALIMAVIGGIIGGKVTNEVEIVGYRRGQEVERAIGHLSRLRAH